MFMGQSRTNCRKVWFKIYFFHIKLNSFTKSSAKCQPFCSGQLNVVLTRYEWISTRFTLLLCVRLDIKYFVHTAIITWYTHTECRLKRGKILISCYLLLKSLGFEHDFWNRQHVHMLRWHCTTSVALGSLMYFVNQHLYDRLNGIILATFWYRHLRKWNFVCDSFSFCFLYWFVFEKHTTFVWLDLHNLFWY